MDSRSLAILLPSAYRPHWLVRCVCSLLTTCAAVPLSIVVSLVEDDEPSRVVLHEIPRVHILTRNVEEYQQGAVWAYNQCLRQAVDSNLYVIAADDEVFSLGWIEATLTELDRLGGSGVVGFNDLCSDGEEYAAHWLTDRRFLIDHFGGVAAPPMYRTWWWDREITDIAKAHGCYAWGRRAIVEHFNYTFGKSKIDRTYREAIPNYEADRATLQARRAAGFPRTWKPILQDAGSKRHDAD